MEKKKIKKIKSTFLNILLSIIVLFSCFLLFEFFLRLTSVNYESYWWGETRSAQLTTKNYHHNNLGFRDTKNYSINKPDNTIRIVSIGDSITYATGIKDYKNSFNKLIEDRFNKNSLSVNYEVINLAKSGVNTKEELEILRRDALKLDPDIVLLNYFLNDAEDFATKIRYRLPRLASLSRHSVFYYFVMSRLDNILQKMNVYPTYEEYLIKIYKESNKELIFHKYLLREFISTTKENNITLIITVLPMIYDFKNYGLKDAHNYVTDIAEEEGIEFLDLLPFFIDFNPKDLKVSIYDAHPNEDGHRIIADAIYNKLIYILNKNDKK